METNSHSKSHLLTIDCVYAWPKKRNPDLGGKPKPGKTKNHEKTTLSLERLLIRRRKTQIVTRNVLKFKLIELFAVFTESPMFFIKTTQPYQTKFH